MHQQESQWWDFYMRVAPDSLSPGRAFLYALAQQGEEADPELGKTQIPVSDLLLTSHTA